MDDLIRRLGRLATSTLANALDEIGLHNQVIAAVRPIAPGFRFAGPAVTVREITGPVGAFPPEDFRVGEMIDAAGRGDVLVVDAGGAPLSTFGGMASFAAKRKGIAGLVVDGGVRDLEEIVEFGFPVFARHLIPTTGRTRLKVEAIGVPVRIDAVEVAPGDVMVGDGTGIVCLPKDRAEEIVTLAETFAAEDAAALRDLDAGLTFREAMAKYRKI